MTHPEVHYPEAVFVFVPAEKVMSEAAELGATPFDVKGCELRHRGEDVSFNSILKKYNLSNPALLLLGEIVRAADSHPSKPHPAGEGLRWVAWVQRAGPDGPLDPATGVRGV